MRGGTRTVLTLAGVAIAMLSMSCGDDESSPTGPAQPETKLAAYNGSLIGTSSVEPSQPYVANVEFGVFDADVTTFDPPDVVLFDDREFVDEVRFIANGANTDGFRKIAARLTDNIDRYVYIRAQAGSSTQTFYNVESLAFQYFSSRPGPDLSGSTITGILVRADVTVTDNGGTWTTALTYNITILGH